MHGIVYLAPHSAVQRHVWQTQPKPAYLGMANGDVCRRAASLLANGDVCRRAASLFLSFTVSLGPAPVLLAPPPTLQKFSSDGHHGAFDKEVLESGCTEC